MSSMQKPTGAYTGTLLSTKVNQPTDRGLNSFTMVFEKLFHNETGENLPVSELAYVRQFTTSKNGRFVDNALKAIGHVSPTGEPLNPAHLDPQDGSFVDHSGVEVTLKYKGQNDSGYDDWEIMMEGGSKSASQSEHTAAKADWSSRYKTLAPEAATVETGTADNPFS